MRGAVLAGGRASRFGGRPKGLEHVGGQRILDRVADAVASATGEWPFLIAEPRSAVGWHPNLRAHGDVVPGCGSLGGIYTALTVTHEATLVVAWDMPFVTHAVLRRLLDDLDSFDAFLPESDAPRGVEPLCAVYGPACIEPIRERLDALDFRATAFHDAVNVGTLPLAEIRKYGNPETLFFNVNTEADLERARAVAEQVTQ